MMIEIYGKTFCPYCDKAKNLCEREGLEYIYKQLDTDFSRDEFFNIFPTAGVLYFMNDYLSLGHF